ncbi:hypothetical protein [Microbulbifer agarilyticus]|uniref:hypothetical protein n=1 Tax=Microbulbifer agarilyticus TaxID=260552 RepID=UPI001C955192|nr:hypothetical protein [Microbulbifer agarilyticus]MBY6213066.1 hypothetical protein [Microbulbifer agarilyticus]MCA0894642.1 hypothetical protein [Microbulbifer agarilyticus]
MPNISAAKLLGVLLMALLVFQQATACYDGHEIAGGPAGATVEITLNLNSDPSESTSANAADFTATPDCCDTTSQQTLASETNTFVELEQGCNHCCHCHASTSLCLPAAPHEQWAASYKQWFNEVEFDIPQDTISGLYRPPIA